MQIMKLSIDVWFRIGQYLAEIQLSDRKSEGAKNLVANPILRKSPLSLSK